MVLPVLAAGITSGISSAVGGATLGSMLGSAGSFLSGLGSLGGLFGNKGTSKKDMWAQAETQYEFQRRLNQTAIRDRVDDAKQAGIHPLYALGAQVSPGGMSMPVPSEQNRFGEMGQNIERAVGAFNESRQRKLLEESTVLDIERKKIENETLRNQAIGSRIALQRQAGTPPANQSVVDYTGPMPAGYAVPKPFWQLTQLPNGRFVRVYNSNDLGDNEWAQAATIPVTAIDALHAYTGAPVGSYIASKIKQFKNRKSKPWERR